MKCTNFIRRIVRCDYKNNNLYIYIYIFINEKKEPKYSVFGSGRAASHANGLWSREAKCAPRDGTKGMGRLVGRINWTRS
jgi:hypothetical protein